MSTGRGGSMHIVACGTPNSQGAGQLTIIITGDQLQPAHWWTRI